MQASSCRFVLTVEVGLCAAGSEWVGGHCGVCLLYGLARKNTCGPQWSFMSSLTALAALARRLHGVNAVCGHLVIAEAGLQRWYWRLLLGLHIRMVTYADLQCLLPRPNYKRTAAFSQKNTLFEPFIENLDHVIAHLIGFCKHRFEELLRSFKLKTIQVVVTI